MCYASYYPNHWQILGFLPNAYKAKRCGDDAIIRVLKSIFSHLDQPGASIRLMFNDFSSEFNTIQSPFLCEKLMRMNAYLYLILWVLDNLTSRPQFVRRSPTLTSNTLKINPGAPQGTVLSPFLFSAYTSDCRSGHDDCILKNTQTKLYYQNLL